MKNKIIILFILIIQSINAQLNYALDTIDKTKRELFKTTFIESNEIFLEELSTKYKGKRLKMLEKNMEEFQKDFKEQLDERKFLFDERFLNKVKEILDHFKETNPQVPKNTRILVSKSPVLNAYCLPDGTFIINMGLFYWLNNEDQVAGVIAHEISHKILEHSIKTQLKAIDEELSTQNKDAIRKLKSLKFNKTDKAFSIFKDKLYARGEMRKKHEYEADSLGYILLKNTKYNKLDYIESLRLMEKYDTIKPKEVKKETYKKLFQLENQPFKEEWMKTEDFSIYDYSYKEKLNKDSIATHPEMEQRIKRLEKNFSELINSKTNEPSEEYKKLDKLAGYNYIPSLMFSEDYGICIYICMSRLQREDLSEEDKKYYEKYLGENFQKIHKARKDYTLNRYLDRIEPKEHDESYIQFLSFMWNLNLNEIKNIADFYSK